MQLFLTNPLIPVDNNRVENALRPFCIGRKNWLFAASILGATASANLYSLVESAKANGLDPYNYLSLVFKELPKLEASLDLLERLLPYNVTKYYEVLSYQTPQ